jgi:hypothetical protein
MKLELPNIVIETIIQALDNGILIQKQARLCDLAALDFIPVEILPHLKLHHQKKMFTKTKFIKSSFGWYAPRDISATNR